MEEETGKITVKQFPVKQIIDLSAQCQSIYPKQIIDPTYLPTFLDQMGILHIFPGLSDNQPKLIKYNC